MKIFQKTFGCQMNVADSDEMIRVFNARGFTETDSEKDADAILINTCTVRQLAEQKGKSYMGRARAWKNERPGRFLFVTGCAAARPGNQFQQRFPHVDLIVGAKDIEIFPERLDAFLKDAMVNEEELVPNRVSLKPTVGLSTVVQYVTIMRGCNYNCTYCIVPTVRGRERYIPIQDVLKETKDRVAEGAKEIWLLGQTVNSYRPPEAPFKGYDFSDLLNDVSLVDGVERIRFMSPHPYYLTDKLIQTFAQNPKVSSHMHLPVQSGSTAMLGRMKRNYTRDAFLAGVNKLKAAVPDIALTTDIIVGFPGETDHEFEETLSLVDEVQFDSAYCFKYSPRPGTPAAALPDDVPQDVKEKRLDVLLEKTNAIALEKAQKQVGTEQKVLIEEEMGENVFRGRNEGFSKVRIEGDLQLGQIVPVNITETHFTELKGKWE